MFFLHFETFNVGAFIIIIIIEDGCLEDGIIIVEDVDAERARCEEWESLDQSLRLEENPSSLQKEKRRRFKKHQSQHFKVEGCQNVLFYQTKVFQQKCEFTK